MKKIFFVLALSVWLLSPAVLAAEDLSSQLAGKVLVATEANGEIWYVNPDTLERQYLGKPEEFLTAMRQVAVGISKKDMASFNGQAPQRLAGKFLLLVDESGKIAYINPADLKIHAFANTNEALEGVKKLALGISNVNLNKIRAKNRLTEQTAQVPVNNQATENNTDNNSAKTDTVSPWVTNKALTDRLKWAAEKYINNELLTSGGAVVTDIQPIYGLYALTVELSTQEEAITSYISPDGKMFFPQGINIADSADDTIVPKETKNVTTTKDKPTVELFVMSHCPFGTQMEKGILPVVTALGDTIDFKLKFVDYAMHGATEIKEQLRQYCIQSEQPDKFVNYLSCFLQAGDTTTCLATSAIDTAVLDACTAKADTTFAITKNYEDKAGWLSGRYPKFDIYKAENQAYGVQGSPTLVVNSRVVSSNRDATSLLKTICQGFTVKPTACDTVLSTSVPSTGFGYGATAVNNNLSCE